MAISRSAARSIGILGYGETPYTKRTNRTLIDLLAEASRKALASSGLTKDDIDGIAVCSFELPPDNAVTLAEQFGLSVSWAYFGTAGGAGPVASVVQAIRAVETGDAKAVICVSGDDYDVAGHYRLMDHFNKALISYGTPNGFGGANGLFGIVQRKHMETYGTRREELGRISVGQRASAEVNENALLRGPMTIDDYMNARIIADPIRLYDCVLPCPGADAVIVAPLDRAQPGKGVKVLSGYERHNHPVGEIAPLRGGWELFRDHLWADAGFGPGDMNFVQAYDDYPIMVGLEMEWLAGSCSMH